MRKKLTDLELMIELKRRFDDNKKALIDVQKMTEKLQVVNDKLVESEKMKTNFLSNIRNEINNPLASIMGISHILLTDDNITDGQKRELIQTISRESFCLNYQLENIFVAAELESGEYIANVSHINIRRIIESTLRAYSRQAEDKHIVFDLAANSAEKQAYDHHTDPERFELVISNIIANAIEFGDDNTTIYIDIQKHDTDFSITITDTGEVIDEEHIGRIFDRFYRIDTGLSRHHGGHGLGLSIVRAIVDTMNGVISVCSDITIRETAFTITFPIVSKLEYDSQFSDESNEFMFEDPLQDDMEIF